MKTILLILLLTLTSFAYDLKGTVKTKENHPVVGLRLEFWRLNIDNNTPLKCIKESGCQMIHTDEEGAFIIQLSTGNYKILISKIPEYQFKMFINIRQYVKVINDFTRLVVSVQATPVITNKDGSIILLPPDSAVSRTTDYFLNPQDLEIQIDSNWTLK